MKTTFLERLEARLIIWATALPDSKTLERLTEREIRRNKRRARMRAIIAHLCGEAR